MLSSIKDIENYLNTFIPAKLVRFPGDEGIIRTKEFLHLLGSPQNKLKVIHVAGTSGKGSTSFMISSLLVAHRFKVGLHLSPHLLDIRERTQINNDLLNEKKYVSYFNEILPAITKIKNSHFGSITYFEIMVGFVFYVFYKEKVQYAVIETGLGGKHDGTNVVDSQDKLSVITRIGLDHMKVLGNTLSEIAYQKAMICVDGGTLITIPQLQTTKNMIEKVVRQKKGHLYIAKMTDREVGMKGDYQKENASLAIAAVSYLAKRDEFEFNDPLSLLKTLRFKGRFDVIQNKGRNIILDGAHNPQKMKAFLQSLKKEFPHKKFTFVIAFKQGKEYTKMLTYILPLANKIIITSIFSENPDFGRLSTSVIEIKKTLNTLHFNHIQIANNKSELEHIFEKEKGAIVVTGSLYLVGDVYGIVANTLQIPSLVISPASTTNVPNA